MENLQANVRGVNRSVVSIGTAGAITNTVNAVPVGDSDGSVAQVLARLAAVLPGMALRPEARAEIEAEIRTVQAQLGSPRPKQVIVQESLRAIRVALEEVAGDASCAELLEMIDRVMAR